MAYAKKTSYSSNSSGSRPSSGGSSQQSKGEESGEEDGKGYDSATTHYTKNTNKEFVNNIQIWENEGKFGTYLKVQVTESLVPGTYFIQARRTDK